jgi:hypothetical protein
VRIQWLRDIAVRLGLIGAVVLTLTSCGGSGVTSTAAVDTGALAVLPPAATLFAGESYTFTVAGGKAPYTLSSGEPEVIALQTTTGQNNFTISPNNPGVIDPNLPAGSVPSRSVTISVRDSTGVIVTASVKVLQNFVTGYGIFFTNIPGTPPSTPNEKTCGGNVCSGDDALVRAIPTNNGLLKPNRQLRFEVVQGQYGFIDDHQGTLPAASITPTLSVLATTDEQGDTVVRLRALATAPAQVAIMKIVDVLTGAFQFTDFTISQNTSGTNGIADILRFLPSGDVEIFGAVGLASPVAAAGSCPNGRGVDYYIFGGTPPYTVVSGIPQVATPSPSVVTENGGHFTAILTGSCGFLHFAVTDFTGRTAETAELKASPGPPGPTPVAPTPVTPVTVTPVTPTPIVLACGETKSVNVTAGNGTSFTATIATAGVTSPGFVVTPPAGTIPGTVSFTRNIGVPPLSSNEPTPITVNITSGSSTQPVVVTVPPIC